MKFRPERAPESSMTYARLAEGSRARLSSSPRPLPAFLHRIDPAYLARLEAVGSAEEATFSSVRRT